MYRKILVPHDGSAVASSVLPVARTLAQSTHAELVLVRVLPSDVGHASPPAEKAHHALARIREELVSSVIGVSTYVRYGDPADEILETADDLEADLIAMGTYGFRGMDRLMVGSVSDDVVARSPVPVLVNRAGAHRVSEIRHILVPTDGSPGAALALSGALPIARATGASLTLIRVTEHVPDTRFHVEEAGEIGWNVKVGHDFQEAQRVRAEDSLRRTTAQLNMAGYTARGVARVGVPATAIVDAALEFHAELVVMSTHGRTGAARAILGSVADEVLRRAECPVVLVHWRDWLGRSEKPLVHTASS